MIGFLALLLRYRRASTVSQTNNAYGQSVIPANGSLSNHLALPQALLVSAILVTVTACSWLPYFHTSAPDAWSTPSIELSGN
jgi:hypothetical protein